MILFSDVHPLMIDGEGDATTPIIIYISKAFFIDLISFTCNKFKGKCFLRHIGFRHNAGYVIMSSRVLFGLSTLVNYVALVFIRSIEHPIRIKLDIIEMLLKFLVERYQVLHINSL